MTYSSLSRFTLVTGLTGTDNRAEVPWTINRTPMNRRKFTYE